MTGPQFIKGVCILLSIAICVYVAYSTVGAYLTISDRAHAYNSLKVIREAQTSFKNKNGSYGSLADLAKAGYITKELAQGTTKGYRFEVKIKEKGYTATAISIKEDMNGTDYYSYFLDESGEIRRDVKKSS